MKKKDTEQAKQFWALAEKTARRVEEWPAWKRQFATGSATKTATTKKPTKTAKPEPHPN